MNMKFFIAFWVLFAVTGIGIVFNTGATFSSVTCVTGEVVGDIKECPQCKTDLDCQGDDHNNNIDLICDFNKQCSPRRCVHLVDCEDSRSICEFNKCVNEDSFKIVK